MVSTLGIYKISTEDNQTSIAAATINYPSTVSINGNKGRKLSEETKAKISAALQGEKNPFYGATHSEEARRKMSEGVKKSWEARRARMAAEKEQNEQGEE